MYAKYKFILHLHRKLVAYNFGRQASRVVIHTRVVV